MHRHPHKSFQKKMLCQHYSGYLNTQRASYINNRNKPNLPIFNLYLRVSQVNPD
jgi:hypothetical protein